VFRDASTEALGVPILLPGTLITIKPASVV
jgi:hypothetical protein